MSPAPLLLAIYPVLVEYSQNLSLLPLDALGRPLLVILLVAFVLTLVLRRGTGSRELGGFYGVLLVAVFWGFRLLLQGLELVGIYGVLAVALAPALTVLLLGLARRRLLALGEEALQEKHRLLLVFLGLLILQAGGQIGWGVLQRQRVDLAVPESALQDLPRAAVRPNIYFVVLDAYVRDDFLRERYGFDNQPFLRQLEERGFYVAREARSNYAWTLLSVSSTLNLSFLDSPDPPTILGLVERARDPLVARFLASQGYRTRSVACGDWAFERTAFQESRGSLLQEFERMLLSRSLVGEFFPQIPDDFSRRQLEANLAALEPFPASGQPGAGQPGFLFLHLMAPHPPFVFLADGTPAHSMPFFGFHDVGGVATDMMMGKGWYRQRYLEQLQWLNRRILERIDAVLAKDPGAIFFLGGDHGSRSYTDARGPEDQLREVHSILSAYRVPASVRQRLYPSITPVNGFRVLFDSLFGSFLGPLPDISFQTPRNDPARRRTIPPFGRLEVSEASPGAAP